MPYHVGPVLPGGSWAAEPVTVTRWDAAREEIDRIAGVEGALAVIRLDEPARIKGLAGYRKVSEWQYRRLRFEGTDGSVTFGWVIDDVRGPVAVREDSSTVKAPPHRDDD